MTFTDTIQSLARSILTNFDEVYHSSEIVTTDNNVKFPAVSIENEWEPLAPTDQREIIYIRRSGDDEVIEELKIGSCTRSYRMRTPLRIVFFKDHAKNKDEIVFKLMQSILITGTKLRSIVRDKWKLQKDESSGDYKFSATTAYFAIDIYALWEIIPDSCEQDFCLDIKNPYCKT